MTSSEQVPVAVHSAQPVNGWRETMAALRRDLEFTESLNLQHVLDNLVTAPEIAGQFGFSSANHVHTYRERGNFPQPVKRFGRIDVYWLPDVREWAEQAGRA